MKPEIPLHLARNIAALREARGLTQAQLARSAGLPRSTVTHLESGAANPSLSSLLAVGQALQVNVEELLSKPRRALEHIPAGEVPVQERAGGSVRVRKLLPDKIRGLHIDLLELEPGAHLPGHPHLRGAKEYLFVAEGELTVFVAGVATRLRKGDVLAFEGDQPHGYKNEGARAARGFSVVIPMAG